MCQEQFVTDLELRQEHLPPEGTGEMVQVSSRYYEGNFPFYQNKKLMALLTSPSSTSQSIRQFTMHHKSQRPSLREDGIKNLVAQSKPVEVTDLDSWGVVPAFVANKFEHWYLNLLRKLIDSPAKDDRTGTGTRSTTFESYKHDLRDSFPALRSRFLKQENPGKELIWMLSGSKDERELAAMGVPFWSEFADETGDLGPVYGHLWRFWPNGDGTTTDQIANIQNELKNNPTSRRMVVNCWHPTFIPDPKNPPKDNYKDGKQALTPCHLMWNVLAQPMSFGDRLDWFKKNDPTRWNRLYPITGSDWCERAELRMNDANVPKHFLDLSYYMRSSDTVLGLPANMNFYATLCHALAAECNMVPRYLCYTGMDVHMYQCHIKGVREQFDFARKNPELVFGTTTQFSFNGDVKNILEMTPDQFNYGDYSRETTGPAIRFYVPV